MIRVKSITGGVVRILVTAGIVMALVSGAAAQRPMISLEGGALGTRDQSDDTLKISLLSWSDAQQAGNIVEAYNEYADNQNSEGFLNFLDEQETKGYLFTAAASGYTVHYAWEYEDAENRRMVLLVTPALKTRNPVLWEAPNTDPAPFSVVEVRWSDGEQATVKTSVDTGITVENSRLALENFESTPAFARVEDSTPYYLRDGS